MLVAITTSYACGTFGVPHNLRGGGGEGARAACTMQHVGQQAV